MFSQTTEYALRAAVWLAENPGQPQTTQQIAHATQVPPSYLSKVLQALGRAGLVRGSRGIGGGFELSRHASQLSILEVVNGVDPIRRIHTCPLGLESHRVRLCPLHRKMDQALAIIEATLAGTTLADVLNEPAVQPLCEAIAQVART